jgi:dTMP kinase
VLVSFEGIDGSGKSTQIRYLMHRLEQEGIKYKEFREPGGTELSEAIRAVLLNPDMVINPVAELLLFSAARSQLVSEQVIPLLNKGYVVILDRFFDSTTAYQGYGRSSLPINEIREMNRIASHGLLPDVTFYLKIEPVDAQVRTTGLRRDRMENSGDRFYDLVTSGYNELATNEKRFKTLDGRLSEQELHDQIWLHLSHLMKEDLS